MMADQSLIRRQPQCRDAGDIVGAGQVQKNASVAECEALPEFRQPTRRANACAGFS